MRQPLIAPTTLPDGASKSIAYQAWVLDKQFDSITKAWERTGLSWSPVHRSVCLGDTALMGAVRWVSIGSW